MLVGRLKAVGHSRFEARCSKRAAPRRSVAVFVRPIADIGRAREVEAAHSRQCGLGFPKVQIIAVEVAGVGELFPIANGD